MMFISCLLNSPVHILHFRSNRWALCSEVVSLSIQVRASGNALPFLGSFILLLRMGVCRVLFCLQGEKEINFNTVSQSHDSYVITTTASRQLNIKKRDCHYDVKRRQMLTLLTGLLSGLVTLNEGRSTFTASGLVTFKQERSTFTASGCCIKLGVLAAPSLI